MDENTERGVSDRQMIGDFSSSGVRKQPISPDRILSVVGNEYRRAVLNSLTSASDGMLEYDTLIDRVAERVRGEDAAGEFDDHRRRIRIELHHTHLPKLEEIRAVEYEGETGHVQFVGGEFEREILTLVESYNTAE